MTTAMRDALAGQFAAALDTLEAAIRACPENLWSDEKRNPQYWYLAYHAIFFADLYLSPGQEGFQPPPPYTLSEFDPSGLMPPRTYTREEMLTYIEHDRRKFRGVMAEWTDERAAKVLAFGSVTGPLAEVMIYNLRHLQHHSAQLNMILRQETNSAPRWIVRGKV